MASAMKGYYSDLDRWRKYSSNFLCIEQQTGHQKYRQMIVGWIKINAVSRASQVLSYCLYTKQDLENII